MEWTRGNKKIDVSMIEYLEGVFKTEMENGYFLNVYVGTDSQTLGRGAYSFATVIIIRKFKSQDNRKTGNGEGAMLVTSTYNKSFKAKNKEAVTERMVFEVSKSIEVAYEIAPILDQYEIPLEVHADINQNPLYESNKALQQSIGYIIGMGYSFKVKPDAFASSYGADYKC